MLKHLLTKCSRCFVFYVYDSYAKSDMEFFCPNCRE